MPERDSFDRDALDRLKPEGWDRSPAVRESFLVWLGADFKPTLIRWSQLLARDAIEDARGIRKVPPSELLDLELLALVQDVRFASGTLANLVQQIVQAPNGYREVAQAPRMARCAFRLGELADELKVLAEATLSGEEG